MSFLQKVFHKKPKTQAPTLSDALQKLRDTEEMLMKKSEYLETRIAKEVADAKRNATKNKKAAIQSLKRKKCLENQLTKIDGVLVTIEVQREALENASVNSNVISSLQIGHGAIAAANKNMTPEKVADMMDDLAELKDDQEKITGAICEHPSNEDDLDMDELEKELAELGAFGEDSEKQPAAAGLPASPTEQDDLDKELAELAAWEPKPDRDRTSRVPLPSVPTKATTSSRARDKLSAVAAESVTTSNTRKKEKAAALALSS